MISKFLSVSIVAKRLQISTRRVRDLIYEGKLDAENVSCGNKKARWRIYEAALEASGLRVRARNDGKGKGRSDYGE